jgi:pyridinium-3,5-biscarboxylic acid mononucleotide sulfurtransferase
LDDKLARLRALVRGMGRVLVAYSGGVDSTFLLRVVSDELRDRAVALTVRSPTAADDEFADAERLARAFGVEHVIVDSNELTIPGYSQNPLNRCYLCKDNLFVLCHAEANRRGIEVILDGANLDDLGDYRPGLRAAEDHRVRHPLVEAELSKSEIRAFSQQLDLPTWDKPASPCLSSRFPYGTEITLDKLTRVGRAERLLHELGFRECRVRYHDQVARIEVPVADLPRLLTEPLRRRLLEAFKQLGFLYVSADLQGFRSGSLNEGLAAAASGPRTDPPGS